MVLIGGSPNPSEYEMEIKKTIDKRIIFPGYIYGDDTNILIKNAFLYIQPSLIEGLSPIILTVMALGTPLICSDIKENIFIAKHNTIYFVSGDVNSLSDKLQYALNNKETLLYNAKHGQTDVSGRFKWENVTDQYIDLLK